MSLLPSKHLCTGCSACYAICPRNAISMHADSEGFIYPDLNANLCVKCGLCRTVCPALNQASGRTPLIVYAAVAKDDAIREKSSSGGVFSLLANKVLHGGGVVFGAAFNHNDWHVYHRGIDNAEDLDELRGSKYVQSEIRDTYRQVKSILISGREVLFSGTPCQVAGLRRYLSVGNIPDEKLLLVDVVCHAVPSPLVWRKYLEKRVSSIGIGRVGELGKIRTVSFRRKNLGWKRFSVSLGFANAMEYLKVFSDDSFMRGCLAELYNRKSCHNCPSKSLKSGSDLTIADYWGIEEKFPQLDDDKGASLVLANTEKGLLLLSAIQDLVILHKSDYEHSRKTNPAIFCSTMPHRSRDKFFEKLHYVDFDRLVNDMLCPSLMQRLRNLIKRVIRFLG